VSGFWDGTFTDYGTAVGTVGLAAITTLSVYREARDRRELKAERDAARNRAAALERLQAEREAQQARRAHAESVSCHIGPWSYDPEIATILPGDGIWLPDAVLECAVIQNRGDKPIRKVDLVWQSLAAPDPKGEAYVAMGGSIETVPPGQARAISRPSSLAGWNRNQLNLLVKFDDANGVRWAIKDDGTLYEATA